MLLNREQFLIYRQKINYVVISSDILAIESLLCFSVNTEIIIYRWTQLKVLRREQLKTGS